jgi:hypothetical protein
VSPAAGANRSFRLAHGIILPPLKIPVNTKIGRCGNRGFLGSPALASPAVAGIDRQYDSQQTRTHRRLAQARRSVVGQFECGRLTDWKREGRGRILRLMDDPAIKLYPAKDSGAWNWELLLRGKRIAYGESSDTQEAAYTAARQALLEERERRSKR